MIPTVIFSPSSYFSSGNMGVIVRDNGDIIYSTSDSYGQADYWWLRSPSTRYGYDNSAYAINLNGIVTDDYANITVNHSSYGVMKYSYLFLR